MAAIPAAPLFAGGPLGGAGGYDPFPGGAAAGALGDGDGGAPATLFSFATNELGRRSFFPSSEISAMPTLQLRHSRHVAGPRGPTVSAAGSLNEEHYGVGAGVSHRVAGCEVSGLWTRVFQREAEIYDKEDRGWQQEYALRARVAPGTSAALSLLRNTTDCMDKDMLDLSLSVEHASRYGTINPCITYLSRRAPAGVEAEQRKGGRVARLTLRTHPGLVGRGGATAYFTHNYRKFDDERGHRTNEAGVTLPFAAGRLTMGAVQCGKEQRELLERSSLASAGAGDGQLGLKVEFEASI